MTARKSTDFNQPPLGLNDLVPSFLIDRAEALGACEPGLLRLRAEPPSPQARASKSRPRTTRGRLR